MKLIMVDVIIEAVPDLVAREGHPALAVRRVATALETGSASLYTHAVNRNDVDELLLGRVYAEVDLPDPAPDIWREEITSFCTRMRDQYLRYPGISRAALAAASVNNDTLRLAECVLAVLFAGGTQSGVSTR
ncbi:hypothetical protein AB0D24_25940 [Streptomyces javensis]|uniref:hypothetical protein n=1 Tax=Streptomyces javensis TaxID=114698 RepID=UPI0033EE73A9